MAIARHPERLGPDLDVEEHRADVLAMLRAKFGDQPDHEDIYQQAWVEALERIGRGAPVPDLPGLLKVIAWRRARDRRRNRSALPADPTGPVMEMNADPRRRPDDAAESLIDSAIVQTVIEELSERQAAAIKMRFELGLESAEIEEILGVSRRRLDKLFRTTYRQIEEQLTPDATGMTPWTRKQRSLIHACMTGIASPGQRERAQRLIEADPASRALVAEIRRTLDRVAAALPLPVLPQLQGDHAVPVLEQLNQSGAALREALANTAGRAGAHAPALEPATGGIASVTAAGAAKVVLVCLSLGGGAAAVCIEVGVLGRDPKPENAQARPYERRKPPKEERTAKVRPKPAPVVVARRAAPVAKPKPAVARPKTNGPPAPIPVPEGSEEFGPGSIGSVPASNEPAAAPADGGGEFTP